MTQKRSRPFSVACAFLAVVALGAACASKPAPSAAEAPVEPAGAGPAAPPGEPSGAPADTPVSSPAASGSASEEEQELPKNCNFKVKGFCFAEQEEACAAADCPPNKCMVLESHPARIKCAN